MKQLFRRGGALCLALLVMLGMVTASASEAMGWEIHKSSAPLSLGTDFGKTIFWSDTYSDLRTEHYVTYSPNTSVQPTVVYGDKVLTKATLSSMAAALEAQGSRVVSGVNGDWYVVSTGAPVGLLVTDGIVRVSPYYNTVWAIGFNDDGTAFIGQPGLTVSVTFGGQYFWLSGGINKVRKITAEDASGGLTLLTSDFAATTQNTQPGVDVILIPEDDGTGTSALEPRIGQLTKYRVEQVLESTGSIPIPEGKAVLTMNGLDNADILAALRALQPGDEVTLSVATNDARWSTASQALGGTYHIVSNGQVASGLPSERTAWPAIGIKADGTIIFYTMDGKQNGYSVGATLTQIAMRLIELGCVEAIGLDGGGSTTFGMTLPTQSAMQVVNRPSDGAQRSNSTAIFLTTQLQPTGLLTSYYVTPSESALLAGSSIQLTASGLDSSYYPTYGGPVEWSVASGGGAVDQNGLFTAGSESGFSQIMVSDGQASGSVSVTTVKTPDTITVFNESTGAAVTSLNMQPGEQISLRASAAYRSISLTAQDQNFTWSIDPSAGTVTQDGLLTAGEYSGKLTVSAGGTSAVVAVNVSDHVNTIADCESTIPFAGNISAEAESETGLDQVRYGKQSMKVTYDLPSSGVSSLTGRLAIPSGERYLGVWVYGDGSYNNLMATAVNTALQESQFLLTTLDFTGWKHVSVPLPDQAAFLTGIQVVRANADRPDWLEYQSGTIWLDQFTTSGREIHDTTPPAVSARFDGALLTAFVQDDVDLTIPKERVSVTYDGVQIAFDWNEDASTLTASLPANGTSHHRVSVTAADASGNLSRYSLSISPTTPQSSPFSDMAGSSYENFASYLYDLGVTNGVPSADGLLFQPDKDITRAEFFALAARWLNLDLTQYAGVALPFADTASIPDWALNEVKAMYSLGMLKGAAVGGALLANSNSPISRAEAMTILGRTQARGYSEAALTAADAGQVPTWAEIYVKSLAAQGVVGENGSDIRSSDLLTRGEMAKMLYSMH